MDFTYELYTEVRPKVGRRVSYSGSWTTEIREGETEDDPVGEGVQSPRISRDGEREGKFWSGE